MNAQTFTPAAADISDMFEELPRRVQVAILSHVHSLRSKVSVNFTEYPQEVAEYIEASGLMNVDFRGNGAVRFQANEATKIIRANIGTYLKFVGEAA